MDWIYNVKRRGVKDNSGSIHLSKYKDGVAINLDREGWKSHWGRESRSSHLDIGSLRCLLGTLGEKMLNWSLDM